MYLVNTFEHIKCILYHSSLLLYAVANEKESIAYKSMPASSENFMGRGDYLMKLREYFDTLDTRSKHRKTFVLHGTGGIGKSQLSIKFAEDNPDL